MQRLARITITIFAVIASCATGQAVSAAQLSPEDMLARLDGIQSAYARKCIADDVLGFVTPIVSDASTPSTLTITVLEFDTPTQATAAFDNVLNGLLTAKLIIGNMDVKLESSNVADLGDQALLFTGQTQRVSGTEYVMLLAVRDGNYGYLLNASGDDPAMQTKVMDIASFMVDAEPGSDPVRVEDLFAVGGSFDLMPNQEDRDLLHGLAPMYDYDLLNNGESPLEHNHTATPES